MYAYTVHCVTVLYTENISHERSVERAPVLCERGVNGT